MGRGMDRYSNRHSGFGEGVNSGGVEREWRGLEWSEKYGS